MERMTEFSLELIGIFMHDFSARRNRHGVMLGARHLFHTLVHNCVSIYNHIYITYCCNTNLQSRVIFSSFMSCVVCLFQSYN